MEEAEEGDKEEAEMKGESDIRQKLAFKVLPLLERHMIDFEEKEEGKVEKSEYS